MHRVMTYMNTFLSQALKKISGNQAEKPSFPFVLQTREQISSNISMEYMNFQL